MNLPDAGSIAAAPCWNSIGVNGDGSCPELEEFVHCRNCPIFAGGGRALLDRPPPEGYRQEWASMLLEHGPEGRRTESLLVFRVGGEWLALESSSVAEVTPRRHVKTIPHRSNDVIRGLANIRGQLELCFSMHGLLDIPVDKSESADTSRFVVFSRRSETWVFDADDVHGVERFADAQRSNVPVTLAEGVATVTSHVYALDSRRVGLLDGDALLEHLQQALT